MASDGAAAFGFAFACLRSCNSLAFLLFHSKWLRLLLFDQIMLLAKGTLWPFKG